MELRTCILFFATLIPIATYAGDDRQQLRAKLDEKLAKPFVEFAGWSTDYDAAKKQAEKENKLLFVYFTRTFSP